MPFSRSTSVKTLAIFGVAATLCSFIKKDPPENSLFYGIPVQKPLDDIVQFLERDSTFTISRFEERGEDPVILRAQVRKPKFCVSKPDSVAFTFSDTWETKSGIAKEFHVADKSLFFYYSNKAARNKEFDSLQVVIKKKLGSAGMVSVDTDPDRQDETGVYFFPEKKSAYPEIDLLKSDTSKTVYYIRLAYLSELKQ
jgi:hypothetical protein